MTDLVIGPLLRHVGGTTRRSGSRPHGRARSRSSGTPSAPGRSAATTTRWSCVDGLAKGSTTAYDVKLDGELVWPPADSDAAAAADPHARPGHDAAGGVRLLPLRDPDAVTDDNQFDADALDTYAKRMARLPDDRWPDALLLLGDQVYADETSDAVRAKIRDAAGHQREPGEQVTDFEEYTWLYHEAWSDPDVRWLLSTIPTSMIFDDHDVRDDWNTSARGGARCSRPPGGRSGSSAACRRTGSTSTSATSRRPTSPTSSTSRCGRHGERLRADAAGVRRRGRQGGRRAQGRAVVLPARPRRRAAAGHRLAVRPGARDGDRSMVSDAEFRWIEAQVEGAYDHLLVGTSLPWLLPRALHDVESWNEVLADGGRGPRMARLAEWFRRAADLEHWAAFRQSFDRLAELFALRRPRRPRRVRRQPPGHDLRAVRRRAPRLRRPGALSATDGPVAGVPADLLAGAQLRAARS